MKEIESGQSIYIRPIIRLKKPETWRGEFKILVEKIEEDKIIDMEGKEYLLADYKITQG